MARMIEQTLHAFGLNALEIEAYTTLLPLGDVPIVDVIKAMGRHPQVVYRVLDQLAARGLVLSDVRRHRRYVRAEDPAVFLRAQEEKIAQLRQTVPELQAIRRKPREAAVHISRGDEAILGLRRRAFDELAPRESYDILSASGTRFYEVMGAALDRIEERRVARGVKKRLLAFESQRKFLDRQEHWGLTEIRYLPEQYDVPSSTNIFADTVAIIIWSQDPILITLESKEVAKSYRNYFDALWKIAKK